MIIDIQNEVKKKPILSLLDILSENGLYTFAESSDWYIIIHNDVRLIVNQHTVGIFQKFAYTESNFIKVDTTPCISIIMDD